MAEGQENSHPGEMNPADQESHFSKWEAQKSSAHAGVNIDASELARLRADGDLFVSGFEKLHEICGYVEYRMNASHLIALIAERRFLIDALEKAKGEHDEIMMSWAGPSATLALIAERGAMERRWKDAAELGMKTERERDSARALLLKLYQAAKMSNDRWPFVEPMMGNIEKELAQ